EYGAVADIFTLAALGDLEGVAGWLERDLDLLNATDPAHDIFRATPLLHAVTSGQSQVALELLRRGAEVGPLSTVLVRAAAEQHDVPLVQSLLHHGADASRVGPGRWVLHAELSQLLTRHGADVNYASNPWATWIWRACTGNHHQQDDPDYVRALIAHGADVNDRHWWGRAALHFACKAGFVRTVRVLLEAGADPNLRDEAGETPLFHVGKASPRVDRRPLIAALLDAGANPQAVNRKGKSALIV
ncbi:MAG: ankyrin repeat domain-containing protein, partial [Gemmataceae bacterium]